MVDLAAEELAQPAWHDAIDVDKAVLAGWRAPRRPKPAGQLELAAAAEAAAAQPVGRGRKAHEEEVASTRPQRKHARSQEVVAIAHPVGSRLAFLFDDGAWREGTVKQAPWAVGHKYQHWRRVRFDYGGVLDVDTAGGPGGRGRTAHGATCTRRTGTNRPGDDAGGSRQ